MYQERTLVDRTAEQRWPWFDHVSRMWSEWLPAKVNMYHSISGRRNQERPAKKKTRNTKEDIVTRDIHSEWCSNDFCTWQRQQETSGRDLIISMNKERKKEDKTIPSIPSLGYNQVKTMQTASALSSTNFGLFLWNYSRSDMVAMTKSW